MKTKEWGIIIVLIIALSAVISLIVVNSFEERQVRRVYFEEKSICIMVPPEGMETDCNKVCNEKGYDGQRGGGYDLSKSECSCNCFKLVK